MGSSNFIAIDCPWQPKWIKLGFEFAKLLFEPLQTSLARLLLDMVGSMANCIGMGSGLENFLNTLFFLLQIVLQTVCSLASDYIFELENVPGEIVVDCRSFNRIGVDIPFYVFLSFIFQSVMANLYNLRWRFSILFYCYIMSFILAILTCLLYDKINCLKELVHLM